MRISLERIDLPLKRLGIGFRFTYAFHAHEIRLETDAGGEYQRIFPETFSFDPDRHDPAELYLQIEDLWSKPQLLAPNATRRDCESLVPRLLAAIPAYLARLFDLFLQECECERKGKEGPSPAANILAGICRDIAVLAPTLLRFIREKELDAEVPVRLAAYHLRKLRYRALRTLVGLRVSDAGREAYLRGSLEPFDCGADSFEVAFLMTLGGSDADAVDSCLLSLAERAFHDWLEEVCLDESNQAFEVEDSPFEDREEEIFDVMRAHPGTAITRGRDLSLFLRRPYNRDCLRVLRKLEVRFLRRYDVPHAAAMIRQGAWMAKGEECGDRRLTLHTTRNFAVGVCVMAAPFVAASVAYDAAPRFFDWLCVAEILAVQITAVWFLLYRFWWKRDLTFFHASVPRVSAGIVVGYLPVFLIDEVWALAGADWAGVSAMITLMGFMTLLYIYAEAQRCLEDPDLAFGRARNIFCLGIIQAFGIGIIVTSLLGPFMVLRSWGEGVANPSIAQLRMEMPHVFGELPRILGVDPFFAFPSAVVVMTFLSFFVGVFLQLLWEDIPLTEPM